MRRTDRPPRTGRVSGAHPDDRDPQTLDTALTRVVDDHGWQVDLKVASMFARWADLVGAEIGAHSQAESFADGKLVVRTDSTAWATQLRLLAPDVVRRLNEDLGHGTVVVIEVLGPARAVVEARPAQRPRTVAVRATPTAERGRRRTIGPDGTGAELPICGAERYVWGHIRTPARASDPASRPVYGPISSTDPPIRGVETWREAPQRLSWTSRPRARPHAARSMSDPGRAGPSGRGDPDEEVRVSDETPKPSDPESVPAATLPEPPNGVEYDASAIQVLEGLEAVRKRPGMYIGSTGERGLHHLIWEIVNNAVDESLAGYCDRVVVTLLADGGVRVEDNGRGIPTDTAPGQELPAVTTVLTVLHAGGKFGGGGYKVSGGLHGVGVSVVNALSSRLVVDVKNRGHLWRQTLQRRCARRRARGRPRARAR